MLPRWLSLKPVVPGDWEDVDARWMTRAIRHRHSDAVVGKVHLVTRADGTNRRARFRLEYAQGTGPEFVFCKAHRAGHRWIHWKNGNLFIEARLYASGAELPLETPVVYEAVPDYPRLDFLLVMEDLEQRDAFMRNTTAPLSVDEVASGLRGLASLHSHYWGITASSHPHLRWVKQWEVSEGWTGGLNRRMPLGLSRTEGCVSDSIQALPGPEIVDLWARFVASLATGPQTLLHGDAHIGNVYTLPDGTCGFLDWQVTRRGNWSQDMGYFLVGTLSPEDRRAHEDELLAIYRDALTVPDKPAMEELRLRYRAGHIYGLAIWLSTLGTDGWQPHDFSRSLVERYGAAFAEQDTVGALDELGS